MYWEDLVSVYWEGLVSVYWEDQTAIDCRSAAGSPSSSYGGAHPRSKKVLWYFARLPISSQIFSQAALYLVFYFILRDTVSRNA